MKTLLTILLGLISFQLFSQRIACENIDSFKLHEIYNELTIENKYSVDEAIRFGTTLAKHDSLIGIKRILLYHGPFTTGCQKCLYHECGFETFDFAPNDLIFENIDAFVDSYNSIMTSLLSTEQLDKIKGFDYSSDYIFTSLLPYKNQYNAERINDTLINFKMSSDTLESIFQKDIDSLKVEIAYSPFDSILIDINYSEIKTIGVRIDLNSLNGNKIYVNYNFEFMPNRYNICWCDILEKKYRMTIPLTNK